MNDQHQQTLQNGRYTITELLGEGALGRTHAAIRRPDGREVAIKELLPSRLKTWKDFELFEREAALLRGLDHPGVPDYYDAFEEPDAAGQPRLFLVQELIDGRTLEEELIANGAFDELSVRAIADEVLGVLEYLHTRPTPVLHRDIKPSNLMRRKDGRVVLIDFGAVAEVLDGGQIGGSGTLVGTFGYMPPEQYAGQAIAGTDLFALGASLAHLLTGRPPETMFGRLFQIQLPSETKLSPGFRYWLDRMIDPDPLRRFGTASEARAVLQSGFLMTSLQRPGAVALLTPDPGEGPRDLPGFFLRDPHSGGSIQLRMLVAGAALLVNLVVTGSFLFPAHALGLVVSLFLLSLGVGMAAQTLKAYRRYLDLYRTGRYTLGEVTGAYLHPKHPGARRIVYRYLDGRTFREASCETRYEKVRELAVGDAIGVLYDASEGGGAMPLWG